MFLIFHSRELFHGVTQVIVVGWGNVLRDNREFWLIRFIVRPSVYNSALAELNTILYVLYMTYDYAIGKLQIEVNFKGVLDLLQFSAEEVKLWFFNMLVESCFRSLDR